VEDALFILKLLYCETLKAIKMKKKMFSVLHRQSVTLRFWEDETIIQQEMNSMHSCWVVSTQLWVRYGQIHPLGYIFNPTFGFDHI